MKKNIYMKKQIEIENEEKIEINASEIISKYKSAVSRKLFCFEKN